MITRGPRPYWTGWFGRMIPVPNPAMEAILL